MPASELPKQVAFTTELPLWHREVVTSDVAPSYVVDAQAIEGSARESRRHSMIRAFLSLMLWCPKHEGV